MTPISERSGQARSIPAEGLLMRIRILAGTVVLAALASTALQTSSPRISPPDSGCISLPGEHPWSTPWGTRLPRSGRMTWSVHVDDWGTWERFDWKRTKADWLPIAWE